MRQGPNNSNNNNSNNNNRRSRSRGSGSGSGGGSGNVSNSGRRQNVPLRHQTFDSNGPDVRIRGNAFQVHEKYLALARDASASGDRIAAENYFQHAEHYFRIINQINESSGDPQRQRHPRGEHPGGGATHDEDGDDDVEDDAGPEGRAPLPTPT